MKVSINLAQEYSSVDLKGILRDELLRRIGAQLGAVEDVVDWAPKFDGAIVVKVMECDKHPNADKLSVCRIDDGGQNQVVERGEDGLVQVVCGAPNVRAGMFAVWLAPGVTVPNSRDTDPFVLEAREIRGIVSNGMMASAHELGISEDHSGIVDITGEDAGSEPLPGTPLTSYFGLDDFVVDCENKMFTHRPDCFGNLGVARELAGISGLKFISPDWYLKIPKFEPRSSLPLQVKNEAPDLVPRFMAVAMKDIAVKPSPMWLQATLARVGIKPINNVVDVTNYVMHLTGQPLHAFDYDKIKEFSNDTGIFPRMSGKGEKLVLLGQKEIELTGEEIVISTDNRAVALAGVMGGYDTEVDENTRNIIIECATFDMYSIRRTSMRHGLFTDAVTRYNKGQSPQQNDRVLAFAMQKMTELAGAEQASDVADIKSDLFKSDTGTVDVTAEFINVRLGSELNPAEMKQMLENVEFSVEVSGDTLKVSSPFWRMDIEEAEDVVEEIGRLYGYDKLPVTLPKRTSKPTQLNELTEFKMHLRYTLKERGANEALTYSFVHGNLLKNTGIDADRWSYHIRNAISPDLQYYRPSLMPSLLNKVHPNIKAQAGSDNNQFALFEIGKAHVKGHDEDNLPKQMERLALVIAADDKTAKSKQTGAAFYLAKKYLESVASGNIEYRPIESNEYPVTAPYAKERSAVVKLNGETIGVVGEFRPEVRKALKLPEFTAGFELDIELLKANAAEKRYQPLPPLPGTHQDYTHEVPIGITWEAVHSALAESFKQAEKLGYQISIEPLSIFQPEDSKTKKVSFRIYISHPGKTLTTAEASRLVTEAADRMTK